MNFTTGQLQEIRQTVAAEACYNYRLADAVVKRLTPDPAVESLLASGYSGRTHKHPLSLEERCPTVWLERSAVEAIVDAVDRIRGRK
jgi:hypothetical protein